MSNKYEDEQHRNKIEAPGTLALSLIFLVVFMVLWFLHFKWLVEVWWVE